MSRSKSRRENGVEFSAQQRDTIEAARGHKGIPGIAAAIVKDGAVLAAGGVGVGDLGTNLPMTAHSASPICSLSKSFTAVAVLQLVEDGLLSLDEPITQRFPALRVAGAACVTPRLLLSHNSGLGRTGHQERMFDGAPDAPPPYRDRADLVARLADAVPQTPPAVTYSYCNEGYVLLSLLVEAITGVSFEAYLERRILAPVGMTESRTRFAEWRVAPDRAATHVEGPNGLEPGRLPADYGVYLASGGVVSTALDLAKYLIASMDGDASPLLSAGSLDQMQSVSNPYGDTGWGYGLGWEIAWDGGLKVVAHDGGLPGVSTYLLMVPSERLGVAVLANRGASGVGRLAEALAATVRGAPLFRQDAADPLPIRTRYPAPDAERLERFAGCYRCGGDWVDVRRAGAGGHLLVTSGSSDDPEVEESPAVAIGDRLFMTLAQGDLLYFLPDPDPDATADDRFPALLAGGDRYRRQA